MARKPRIQFEGAFYHVITRGNQRQKIFKDEEDNRQYLEILTKYKDRLLTHGRKLLSLVAHEYGYSGRDIAEYMRKDPALITRYIKEKEELKKDVEQVIDVMKDRKDNVNSQA